jgi:hypothetical protein
VRKVEPLLLQPGEEGGPGEAAVGQDDGADTERQDARNRQERFLFQLVLALARRQRVPVVGQLQEGEGPTASRDGDAQHLVADAPPAGEWAVEEGPVDGEAEQARRAERRHRLRDEGQLQGTRVDARIVEEAPEPLDAMQ